MNKALTKNRSCVAVPTKEGGGGGLGNGTCSLVVEPT